MIKFQVVGRAGYKIRSLFKACTNIQVFNTYLDGDTNNWVEDGTIQHHYLKFENTELGTKRQCSHTPMYHMSYYGRYSLNVYNTNR